MAKNLVGRLVSVTIRSAFSEWKRIFFLSICFGLLAKFYLFSDQKFDHDAVFIFLFSFLFGIVLFTFFIPTSSIVNNWREIGSVLNNKNDKLSEIDEFIDRIDKENKEFVLILRQFKNEGAFYILKNKEKITFFHKFEYIETALERSFKSNAYLLCTISNPHEGLHVNGPEKINAESDWTISLLKLMSRAISVIFIFGDEMKITPSLRWEIKKSISLGLSDRTFFLFSPSYRYFGDDPKEKIVDDITKIYMNINSNNIKKIITGGIQSTRRIVLIKMGFAPFILYSEDFDKPHAQTGKKSSYSNRYMLVDYYNVINKILDLLNYETKKMQSIPFDQKYPYYQKYKTLKNRSFKNIIPFKRRQ